MKKRTVKSLALNKKSVSNLELTGGASPGPPRSDARTGCVSCAYSCNRCGYTEYDGCRREA